jgi:regulator of replication initiation timing
LIHIELKENLNFHVDENIFVDVDVRELKDVLRTSEHTAVDENDEINKL